MCSTELLRLFQFNQMTLERLLASVSQEDSLKTVEPAENCINWLLGHIIFARGELLSILGSEPDWHTVHMAVYGERGVGTFTVKNAKPLPDLQRLLDQSLTLLTEVLPKVGAALNEPCDQLPHVSKGGSVADRVGTYACHEAYHAGQIGLMRRLLGKPGLF